VRKGAVSLDSDYVGDIERVNEGNMQGGRNTHNMCLYQTESS